MLLDHIKMMNGIVENHFTDGGHFMSTGSPSFDRFIMTAWYVRWSLEAHEGMVKRACNLMRAKEELTRLISLDPLWLNTPGIESVQNALSWATSHFCDDLRKLEGNKR